MKKNSLVCFLIVFIFALDSIAVEEVKTALITGSSRGIGFALAKKFIEEKYNIVAVARNTSEIKELKRQFPSQVEVIGSDISSKGGRHEVIGFLLKKNIKLNYLVNNAGIIDPISKLEGLDEDKFDQIIQTNLIAPIMLTSMLLKNNIIDKKSRILNISSIGADSPLPGILAYSTTKGGLDVFTKASLKEGYVIASVNPGEVNTTMQELLREASIKEFPNKKQFQDAKKKGMLISTDLSADYLFWLITASDKEYFISRKHNIYDKEHHLYWIADRKLPLNNR